MIFRKNNYREAANLTGSGSLYKQMVPVRSSATVIAGSDAKEFVYVTGDARVPKRGLSSRAPVAGGSVRYVDGMYNFWGNVILSSSSTIVISFAMSADNDIAE